MINIHNQRGMTFISMILMLVIAGFFMLLVLKLGPVYLENYTVKMVLANVQQEPGMNTRPSREIRRRIDDQLYINEVRRLKSKDIKIKRENNVVTIRINYHVRVHIAANVDAIVSFKESAMLDGT